MKFFTPYNNRPPQGGSAVGGRVDPEYGEVLNDQGRVEIQRVSFKNRFAETQEAKTPDVYDMLRDTGMDPDRVMTASANLEGLVDDFASVPRSIPEAVLLHKKAEASFLNLPLEVRAEFDNDPGVLLASLSDGSFALKMAKFIKGKEENKDE